MPQRGRLCYWRTAKSAFERARSPCIVKGQAIAGGGCPVRVPLIVAVLVLLAGCTESYRWSKPAVNAEQRKEDLASCRATAAKKAEEQTTQALDRLAEPPRSSQRLVGK